MTIHPFHARNDQHRSAVTWQMLIESAQDAQEVLRIARDFVASFTPHEIDLLPAGCRPGKLVDGDDIANYGYDLAVHCWDVDENAAPVVQAFARFFADAAERVAQLARTSRDTDDRESA